MNGPTWYGVPAVYFTNENGEACIRLPFGHPEMGYAPGSEFLDPDEIG